MSKEEYTKRLSPILFWDVDRKLFDMDVYPAFLIQRVLEYGTLDDWRIIRDYYGLNKIVKYCKQMRTLDPMALSFICCISHTKEEEYRCYHFKRLNPELCSFSER